MFPVQSLCKRNGVSSSVVSLTKQKDVCVLSCSDAAVCILCRADCWQRQFSFGKAGRTTTSISFRCFILFGFQGMSIHIRLGWSSKRTVLKTALCHLDKRDVVTSNKGLMCSHQVSHYAPHAAAFYHQEVLVNAQSMDTDPLPDFGLSILMRLAFCHFVQPLWRRWTNPQPLVATLKLDFHNYVFFCLFFFKRVSPPFIYCLWFMMWFLSCLEYHHGTNAESTMWPRVYPIRPPRFQH